MLPILLAITFFTRQLSAVTSSCHNGCNCFSEFVTCSDLKSLKGMSLPQDTATLVLRNMQVESIPRHAFRSLNALTVLELQNNTIRSIAEGAFSGLENMDTIMIVLNTIDIINRKAFSDMQNITHMTFSRNVIGSVRRDAFSNLTNIKEITFQSNNFTSIRRHAFHHLKSTQFFQFYLNNVRGTVEADSFSNINQFETVNIYLNHFRTLECRTLDTLVLSAQKISIYSNKFKCHCKLAWMLSQTSMKRYLSSNWCTISRLSKELILSSVTVKDLNCTLTNPTFKQHGCPNAKTKTKTFSSTVASNREDSSTVSPLKETTHLKRGTTVVRQTSTLQFSNTVPTVTERDMSSLKIIPTVKTPITRTSLYTSSISMDTLTTSLTSTTPSRTSTIKTNTTLTLSTPRASSHASITTIDTLVTSPASKIPDINITNTDTLTSTSTLSFTIRTKEKIDKTVTPVTSKSSSVTSITTPHTQQTSQISKTLFTSNPESNTSMESSTSKTSSSTNKLATTFAHTVRGIGLVDQQTSQSKTNSITNSAFFTAVSIQPNPSFTLRSTSIVTSSRTLDQQVTSKPSDLPNLNQTTPTIHNSTSPATNQPDSSSTLSTALSATSDVQRETPNVGKDDLSTKLSVKDLYRHKVTLNEGHVITADAGSLSVVLYLTLTALIC